MYSMCSIPINPKSTLAVFRSYKLILTQIQNSIGAPLDQIENRSTCNPIAGKPSLACLRSHEHNLQQQIPKSKLSSLIILEP